MAAATLDSTLPEPVERYLRRALGKTTAPIQVANLRQRGELRMDARHRWGRFEAEQTVRPEEIAFEWNARAYAGRFLHVAVRDAYRRGEAEARVRFLSVLTLGHERGGAQLNSGALHRFLAEAPWYPTALRPSSRLAWEPIDADRARATLRDGTTQASLEFRFDTFGDVAAIYAAARPRRRRGGFDIAPWEGHFRDYRAQDGLRIPMYGEVGWYEGDRWEAVWKGTIVAARYEFAP